MSRSRKLSTDVSVDKALNRVAQTSDFAALLYTWMIPHADDEAKLTGDTEEILWTVMPGRRDKTGEDIDAALDILIDAELIIWNGGEVYFPRDAFYSRQSYIPEGKRRTADPEPEERQSAKNSEERRQSAKNSASPSPSPSPSPSLSPSPSTATGGALAQLRALPGYSIKSDDEEWLDAHARRFPRICLADEIGKCRDWYEPKDARKKTKPNWRSRLNNWLPNAKPPPVLAAVPDDAEQRLRTARDMVREGFDDDLVLDQLKGDKVLFFDITGRQYA